MKHTLVIALAVALSACGGTGAGTSIVTEMPTSRDERRPPAVQLAVEQLADRLGISESEIEVASVKSVQWPDASLGCEMEPGTFERRVTPGYLVILRAEGERFEYHTDEGERAVQCDLLLPQPQAGGQDQVKLARADLAARLGVEPSSIEVVRVEEAIWNDSSLGCPAPGQFYAQVMTSGYLILLEASGETYRYHTDDQSTVILCEDGVPGADNPLVAGAREDLAARLHVSSESIRIVSVENVTWPDSSLGCPQPGMAYAQVPVDGILIRLEYDGVLYQYHGGGNRDPFLCDNPSPLFATPRPGDDEFVPPPGYDY